LDQLINLQNERSAGINDTCQLEKYLATRFPIIHLFPKGIVSLDLETTGLSATNHEIIEVGAIKILPDGQIKIFHELWRPELSISESSRKIHGLSIEMLASAPTANERINDLMNFIGDSPILAHNAQYDIGFLSTYLINQKRDLPQNLIYDSCHLSRFFFNKFLKTVSNGETYAVPKNHKLESLKEFLGVDLIGHYALPDALAALKIFLHPLLSFQSDQLKLQEILIKSCQGPWAQLVASKTGQKENLNLNLLQDIMARHADCEIIYHGGSIKGAWRPITPLHLVRAKQGLILVATCLIENQNKHFTLRKIGQIKEKVENDNQNECKLEANL
jgi:DNA polymerase-3 subunit epsilon